MMAILIDFSKAFDRISRPALRVILLNFVKLDVNVVERIMDLLTNTSATVGNKSNCVNFSTDSGVRQGCPLGPILFICVLKYLVDIIEDRSGIKFHYEYADDLTCLDSDINKLLKVVEIIKEIGPRLGLIINEKKTEWISVEDAKFKQQSQLLGSWIGDWEKTVQLRIVKAKRSFYALYNKLWKHQNVSFKTKFRVFESICMSTLLYGLESVALSPARCQKIDSFSFRCYKIMLNMWFAKDGYISKASVYQLVQDSLGADKLYKPSEILRLRRLENYYHFRRNHRNDSNNLQNYRSETPNANCDGIKRLLLDVIEGDRRLLPSFVPRLH